MKIFYGDNDDRDFSNTQKYAYLNWWFDDGYGKNQCSYQHIFDNFNMGKAFIGNALLTLYNILELNNSMSVADKLIFPILFDLWHGLELWLKSSVSALELRNTGNSRFKRGHDISKLMGEMETLLKNNDYGDNLLKSIVPVRNIIAEFKRVGANFDFARYSFRNNKDFQFYNAPYKSDKQWQSARDDINQNIVPNTCVDINNLFELLADIFQVFGCFVEYLTYCISEGDEISDKSYCEYLTMLKKYEKTFKQYDLQDTKRPAQIIINEIMK